MTALSEYRKAIGAGLVTFGGALVTAALSDGITGSEWYGIVGATLAAVGTVWAVPNTPDATATDTSPVVVSQKDSTGTVTGTVVVPGPGATIREPEGN